MKKYLSMVSATVVIGALRANTHLEQFRFASISPAPHGNVAIGGQKRTLNP